MPHTSLSPHAPVQLLFQAEVQRQKEARRLQEEEARGGGSRVGRIAGGASAAWAAIPTAADAIAVPATPTDVGASTNGVLDAATAPSAARGDSWKVMDSLSESTEEWCDKAERVLAGECGLVRLLATQLA